MSYLSSDLKIVSLSFCRAEEIPLSQLSNEATTSNIVKIPNSNSDNVFKISYDSPNRPQNFDFPRTDPKGHERSFQPTWFKSFSWLHYDDRTDLAETNSLSTQSLSQGDAFLKQGFQNWKRATKKSRVFRKHEMPKAHKEFASSFCWLQRVTQKVKEFSQESEE